MMIIIPEQSEFDFVVWFVVDQQSQIPSVQFVDCESQQIRSLPVC